MGINYFFNKGEKYRKLPTFFLLILLILSVYIFYIFNFNEPNNKKNPGIQNKINCYSYKAKLIYGKVVKIERNRGNNYKLENGEYFRRWCAKGEKIKIGDSIYKPKGTLNYFIYINSNPDSMVYVKCNFNCDTLQIIYELKKDN